MPLFFPLGNKNIVNKIYIVKKDFELWRSFYSWTTEIILQEEWRRLAMSSSYVWVNNGTDRLSKSAPKGNDQQICLQLLHFEHSHSFPRVTSNGVCYRGDKINDLDCDHVNIARQQLQLWFFPTVCLQNVFSACVVINEGRKKVLRRSFWK